MGSRPFLLASLMIGLACGPQPHPSFSGVYSVTKAYGTCHIESSEEAPSLVGYDVDDVVIDEDGSGRFPLELPLPPCPIEGVIDYDRILLDADDCVIELATGSARAYAVEYTEGRGSGRWDDEGLVLRIGMARQNDSIPPGYPDWWGDPGRCSSSYTLEPLE